MAKLTNKEILDKVNVLGNISNRNLPVRVSYALAKNISKIENELKHYNNERAKIIERYCEKDEEGNSKIENGNYVIKKDEIENWNKDMKDLQDIENEFDVHKFNLELLNGYDMTANEMMCIDFMIEE